MTKAAIIISAILVFAGIAAAGTLSSSGGSNSPTISTPTVQTTTGDDVRQDNPADDAQGVEDVTAVRRGRARERSALHGRRDRCPGRRRRRRQRPPRSEQRPRRRERRRQRKLRRTAEATPATAEAMTTVGTSLSPARQRSRQPGPLRFPAERAKCRRAARNVWSSSSRTKPSIAEPLAEAIAPRGLRDEGRRNGRGVARARGARSSPTSSCST